MSTIEQDIRTHIAAVFATVAGVVRTFDRLPPAITPADLPAVFSIPRQATSTGNTAPRWLEVTRNYNIQIYVAPVQSGEASDAEAAAVAWINTGMLTILQHPNINPGTVSGGQVFAEMEYVSDTGLTVFQVGQTGYIGVEFTVKITYKVPYSFAKYE
jgi:hypothetical protein